MSVDSFTGFPTGVGTFLTELAPAGLADLQGSAFRIYRDLRFSKDKTPYKTDLVISFNAVGSPKGGSPGYYFHLERKLQTRPGGLPRLPLCNYGPVLEWLLEASIA